MSTVAQILRLKADQTMHTISPDASVFDAISMLAEKNIGALPVVKDGKVVGMISERNYSRKVALAGRSSRDTPVADIMDTDVLYVGPENTREECMALMSEKRIRHLVVVNNGELAGVISIGDVVKDTIAEQEFVIQQLEQYIAGDRG